MDRRILRTVEAAEYIGLTASSLEKMRGRGCGPRFVKLGSRAVGYRLDDIDVVRPSFVVLDWIDAQRRKTTTKPKAGTSPTRLVRS